MLSFGIYLIIYNSWKDYSIRLYLIEEIGRKMYVVFLVYELFCVVINKYIVNTGLEYVKYFLILLYEY